MTFQEKLEKFARLLVELGVNLQKGQYLLLDIDAENYVLARAIAEAALSRGAADVIVHWSEPYIDRSRAVYGSGKALDAVANWEMESYAQYIKAGACSLRVISTYPTLFEGVDPRRAAEVQRHQNNTRNLLRKGTAEYGMHWCISVAPSVNWAKFLFPDSSEQEAMEQLWNVLLKVCCIDEHDPVENWMKVMSRNSAYVNLLNKSKVDSIHFSNGTGTNLTIGFQPKVRWVGAQAAEYTPETYLPNLPTAEVSTSPDKYRVDGTVAASRPMMEGGTIIKDFGFTFQNGKVVDFYAGVGYEALKDLLNTDEGARYLGEVAFVPCDSPIAQTGLLFLNTLLDENAACHLALGRGFSVLFENLSGTDYSQWDAVNLNHSDIHVDFMFGTPDMNAEVTLADGRKLLIFKNGRFNPEALESGKRF